MGVSFLSVVARSGFLSVAALIVLGCLSLIVLGCRKPLVLDTGESTNVQAAAGSSSIRQDSREAGLTARIHTMCFSGDFAKTARSRARTRGLVHWTRPAAE